MVDIVETDEPEGSASGADSVPAEETHSDDGAVELVIVDEKRAASQDSDEGEDEADQSDGRETDDGPEGLEDELRQIRKPKLREQMRQLRQENWKARQAITMLAQEREQYGTAFQQLQARAVQAEVRALDTEIAGLQRHQQWLQQQYTSASENGNAKALAEITAAMADSNNRLMQAQGHRSRYGNGQPGPMQQQPQMQRPQMAQQPRQQPGPVVLDSAAQKWMKTHEEWHQNNPERLRVVGMEAIRLQEQGIPPEDPEHYTRLNRVLAARFDDFRPAAPRRREGQPSAVAPVARTTTSSGKTRYEITKEDSDYLKRMGLDPKTNPQGFKEWRAHRDAIAKTGAFDGRGKIAIQIDA